MYDGSKLVEETAGRIDYKLYILFYERSKHFQPILNLVGASGCRGFCATCNKSFERLENHKCKAKCVRCFQNPLCEVAAATDLVKCRQCCREFYGDTCFQNHLKAQSFDRKFSVCESVATCQTCCKTVRFKRNEKNREPHECGKSFCFFCRQSMPVGHLCHIQPIPPTASFEGTDEGQVEGVKILYIFYDFETQQSQSVLGDEDKKIHVVNLCVAHKICTMCFNEADISVRCSMCGIRKFVFKISPVQQLVDLVMDFRVRFKKVICVAHNYSGFDANFILKYLVEQYGE